MKEKRRMWTCNRLDLQTLGFQLIMPKNLPDHWTEPHLAIASGVGSIPHWAILVTLAMILPNICYGVTNLVNRLKSCGSEGARQT